MASISPNNISWLLNGQSRHKEGFIDIDAGGAELGQSCADQDCKQGTCFQANDKADEKCMYVLMQNEKGCTSKQFSTCTQGLTCVNDVCVFPNQKPPTEPTTTTPKKEEVASQADNERFDKLVLYSFMIGILLMIIIMFILFALGL